MKLVLLGTTGYHANDRRQTACMLLPEIGVMFDAGTALYRDKVNQVVAELARCQQALAATGRYSHPGFLAAYNAGPDRYAQHLATGAALPAETQNYVAMLAPVIDGSQSERAANTADNALNWRSASLFTAPIHHKLNDPRSASSLLPSTASRDATIVDLSALVPPSN